MLMSLGTTRASSKRHKKYQRHRDLFAPLCSLRLLGVLCVLLLADLAAGEYRPDRLDPPLTHGDQFVVLVDAWARMDR